MTRYYDVVVVGGGQAGLATGHHLARTGRSFVVLDAGDRVGAAWRQRWDSLRLFTPAGVNGLPRRPFPARASYRPTKDEMADYLEEYAAASQLPVRSATTVRRVSAGDAGFVVDTDRASFVTGSVVIATGPFTVPRVPSFAEQLAAPVRQLHSAEYRRPAQLDEGPVLVVGAGNSGGEIALDLAPTRQVWLSGRDTGHLPAGGPTALYRALPRIRADRGIGRVVADRLGGRGTPLVGITAADLRRAGIERVGKVVGVRDGRPLLADGRVLDAATVLWCTGFDRDYTWIDLPAFGRHGRPVHHRGVARDVAGLYFVGMQYQNTLASGIVAGAGSDAAAVVAAMSSTWLVS